MLQNEGVYYVLYLLIHELRLNISRLFVTAPLGQGFLKPSVLHPPWINGVSQQQNPGFGQ